MAAGDWTLYNTFREAMADGTVDLDDDTFVCLLTTSSYSPDVENDVDEDDLSNELSGNGYARDTLTASWTRTGTKVVFNSDNAVYTASGGPLTARYAVILDTTADVLVAYCVLDDSPADVSVTDGNNLTIDMDDTDGVFYIDDAA